MSERLEVCLAYQSDFQIVDGRLAAFECPVEGFKFVRDRGARV